MMRVFLAGEGKTELGELAKEVALRDRPGEKGVLVALIERVGGDAITVVDGVIWSRIHKYQAGRHASPETRNVLGLALTALHSRCDILVFSRDRDGSVARESDLDEGIRRAHELFPKLALVGGMAIENIEGWLLVVLGFPGESVPAKKTKTELQTQFGIVTVREKVDAVASASLEKVGPGSLQIWLERARRACVQPKDHDSA
jgi:hypothetical protein